MSHHGYTASYSVCGWALCSLLLPVHNCHPKISCPIFDHRLPTESGQELGDGYHIVYVHLLKFSIEKVVVMAH